MVVSVLANGLLAAETVERMVCVANSVRRSVTVYRRLSAHRRCRAATDSWRCTVACWPLRSASVGTAQSLVCSRIAAQCTQCSVQCAAKRTAYATQGKLPYSIINGNNTKIARSLWPGCRDCKKCESWDHSFSKRERRYCEISPR